MFDGPEDYHARIDDPALAIDEHCILVMRGTGPIGYPGGAEVVNMRAPVQLIAQGVHALPCIGDGRQSGTSGSPSILNASPEAAIGGGLAVLKTGDRVRVDLRKGEVNVLLSEAELQQRHQALEAAGGYVYPDQPDTVAGNAARRHRPDGHRRGARTGCQIPAYRAHQGYSPPQSLVRGGQKGGEAA